MIIQYLKNKKGQRVGCLVGTAEGIGWSKVHGKFDKFSRARGLQIALGRAYKRCTFVVETPPRLVAKSENGFVTPLSALVIQHLPAFVQRYKRYYKYDPF